MDRALDVKHCCLNFFKDIHYTYNFFLKYSMLKATKFLFDTNEGMSLFTREEIDITEMTKTDCFLFWQQIELYDLLFFNNKRCPLVLRDGKVLNDLEIDNEEMKNYIYNKQESHIYIERKL